MGTPYTKYTAGDGISEDINTDYGYLRDSVVEIPTVEAIDASSVPKPIYIAAGSGWLGMCDANDTDKLGFVGFVLQGENVGEGEFIKCVLQDGIILDGFSGLSRGENYYIQDDGSIGTSPGTYPIQVGIAISATRLMISRSKCVPGLYGSSQSDESGASAAVTDNFFIYTPGRARLIEFCVCVMSIMQSGSNGTKIATYRVLLDLVTQKYQAIQLYAPAADNQTSISMYTSATVDLKKSEYKYTNFSTLSNTSFSSGGISLSRINTITSDRNKITFNYTINLNANSNQGGIIISGIKVFG